MANQINLTEEQRAAKSALVSRGQTIRETTTPAGRGYARVVGEWTLLADAVLSRWGTCSSVDDTAYLRRMMSEYPAIMAGSWQNLAKD